MQEDPSKRPSASEALTQYEETISSLPGYLRRRRLKGKGKGKISSLFHDTRSVGGELLFIVRSVFVSLSRHSLSFHLVFFRLSWSFPRFF